MHDSNLKIETREILENFFLSCRTNKRIKDSRRKFREPGAGSWGWHEKSCLISWENELRSSSWTHFFAWGTAACVQFNWKLFSHQLNSAEHVGRLTPSTQSVERTKKRFLFIFKPRAWQQKLFRCNEECDRATYACGDNSKREKAEFLNVCALNALPTKWRLTSLAFWSRRLSSRLSDWQSY